MGKMIWFVGCPHAHSGYRGGGTYGDYGGYDIALLELDDEINAKLACLPGPSFNDQDTYGSLAGYGKYLRDYGRTCETNQYGMSKHHYCKKSRCKSDKPPPQNKLCEKFFREIGNWSENGKYTEALIIDNGESISCHNDFNPENENYGWCWTKEICQNCHDLANEAKIVRCIFMGWTQNS